MKVQVEELSPIERKLSIEVESGIVTQELDRAYAELGRHVKLAGFRPGKVPRRILERQYKEQVEDDVIQRVVQKAFLEAIREKNVDAVSNPQVTNKGLRINEPFAFEARVEVKPKIDPKDYAGVPLEKTEVQVDEAKVTEQLERMRQRMARLEPVTGRDVAQKGDWGLIDFDATLNGKPFPGSKAENIMVEIADGELSRGNLPQLDGVKVGTAKEFDYAFPKDHPVAEVGGKSAHFKVQLKGLKQQVTPELNDDLAKEVQGGQTLEELKTRIRTDLERSLRAKANQDERDALIRALSERNPFDVPKAMEDRAVDAMLRGTARAMADQGMDVTKMGIDFDRLREEMRPKAHLEVKGTLLFEAIAEKEGIQASDEDVDKRLEKAAAEEKVALSQLRKQFRNPEERKQLQMRVREEKTVEFLKAKASYSSKP